MADLGGLLGVGPDHEARRVHQADHRQPWALHSCMKRAALSAASASIAPPRWAGCWPAGRPGGLRCAPAPCGCRRRSRCAASSRLPASARPAMAARVSYTRSRFSGTTARKASGSGAVHAVTRPWKNAQVVPCRATACALPSSTSMSITPLRCCTPLGPICSGLKTPSPPPRPPWRAAHYRCCCRGWHDHHVAAAQQCRVAGEAAAATMPTTGTWPLSRAKLAKGGSHADPPRWACRCLLADRRRPRQTAPPAALCCSADAEPVGLLVVAHALGAGQPGGVVGHDHRAAALGPEQRTVDAAYARDHAVGRVLCARSSALRQRAWAATASAPYSLKDSGSTWVGVFSRAVQACAWRLLPRRGVRRPGSGASRACRRWVGPRWCARPAPLAGVGWGSSPGCDRVDTA